MCHPSDLRVIDNVPAVPRNALSLQDAVNGIAASVKLGGDLRDRDAGGVEASDLAAFGGCGLGPAWCV